METMKTYQIKNSDKQIRYGISSNKIQDLLTDEIIDEFELPIDLYYNFIRDRIRWAYVAGHDQGRIDSRNGKEVCQLNLEGELIRIWQTAVIAGRALNINHSSIYRSCRRGQMKAGGYLWDFAKDYYKKQN